MSRKIFLILLSLLLVVSLLNPQPGQADVAPKNTTSSGPFAPGNEVPIEIKITKPTTPPTTIDPLEVMIVMDLSGSISNEISTAQSALLKFADDLTPYDGLVKVGIFTFGSGVGSFSPTIIDSTNVQSFKTAVQNMSVGCSNCGRSDILKGMQSGNDAFTNTAAKKYLFLLTDGYANSIPNPLKPSPGQLRTSGNCPVKVVNNAQSALSYLAPTIALNSTTFRVLPLKNGTDYTRPLNDTTNGPCGGSYQQVGQNAYTDWGKYHNSPTIKSVCVAGKDRSWGSAACDLLSDMADSPRRVYPNSAIINSISPDLDGIINQAALLKEVKTIQLQDTLNSNVFDIAKGIKDIAVYRCGTTVSIGSFSLSAVGLTISGNITNLGSETNFCIRFTATVKNTPTTGQTTINTTSNSINHRNSAGTIIRSDTIAPGSIQISNPTPSLSFNTEAPAGTIVQPGASAAIQNVNLTYLPNLSNWGNKQLTISVVAILSGATSCSAYTVNSPAITSGSGINVVIPHSGAVGGSYTFAASSRNQVSLELSATSATQGTYTLCIASKSTNGVANNPMIARTFEVRYASWLQIAGPSVSRQTGDVHSNGGLTFTIPPNQYFFRASLAGLVSASSSTNSLSLTAGRLASLIEWRIAGYNQITSPGYDKLLEMASNKSGQPESRSATSAGAGQAHTMAQCAAGQTKAFRVAGDLSRDIATSLTNANCPNASTIYFIDGNLTVSQNISDDTNNSSLTFIVKGNIIVTANVTRLDGVYIFGGSFRDGSGSQPLTIKGSLIGLAGSNPSSGNGVFNQGASSGFQRNLGAGNTNPAETIIYQPKYLHLIDAILGGSSLSWQEN